MHNYSERDQETLELFYNLNQGRPYNPPSYTCIKEFTNSFPKHIVPELESEKPAPKFEWQPEPPYPRIYTNDYKKN